MRLTHTIAAKLILTGAMLLAVAAAEARGGRRGHAARPGHRRPVRHRKLRWLRLRGAAVSDGTSTESAASAAEWVVYRSDEQGLQMAVPEGTQLKDKKWSKGWTGARGKYETLEFCAAANPGMDLTLTDIQSFATRVTGISASHWTETGNGKNDNGWTSYRVYKATKGTKGILGIMGTGPKGSYLVFMKMTSEELDAYGHEYQDWCKTVKLF